MGYSQRQSENSGSVSSLQKCNFSPLRTSQTVGYSPAQYTSNEQLTRTNRYRDKTWRTENITISSFLIEYFSCGAWIWFRVMATLYVASPSHPLDTPQSFGLFWPSDQHLPDNAQHSQGTGINVPGGIRGHNLSKRAVADPRLRLSGRWNRQ